MATVTLNGHRTWAYVAKRRRRKRPTLVLLHGGLSSSASLLGTIGPHLERDFRLAAFDRRGHGRTADTDEPFHYEYMVTETIAFLKHLDRRAHLVGHSDGAIVALMVAMRRPDLVKRVVAVGANYHYSALRPMDEFGVDGPNFKKWARWYAKVSPDGRSHARAVVEKTLQMFRTEPTLGVRDLERITVPVLVMAGDDEPINLDHTCSMYEVIRDAQLAIVPGASHEVLRERPRESSRIIRRFLLSSLPPRTYMPSRRRDGKGQKR